MGNLHASSSAADVASFVQALGRPYQRDSELIVQFGICGALLTSAEDVSALFSFMEDSSSVSQRQTVLKACFDVFKAAQQDATIRAEYNASLPSQSVFLGPEVSRELSDAQPAPPTPAPLTALPLPHPDRRTACHRSDQGEVSLPEGREVSCLVR